MSSINADWQLLPNTSDEMLRNKAKSRQGMESLEAII